MHAKKVAGRQGPGGLNGEMDPKTRAAAAAAANPLFIFLLSEPPRRQKLPRQVKPYGHSQVAIRLCCDIFLIARSAASAKQVQQSVITSQHGTRRLRRVV
jgi:hypothetical protein